MGPLGSCIYNFSSFRNTSGKERPLKDHTGLTNDLQARNTCSKPTDYPRVMALLRRLEIARLADPREVRAS